MDILQLIFQIVIPLGIFNVWFLRAGRSTTYRGKDATSLKAEFTAYGLPETMFYIVGTLKISAAVLLLLGFFLPILILPGAFLMSLLMLGAVIMHFKVNDPPIRFVPATLMLLMSLALVF
ncbi:MAG: DoxX family protein [Verrucomicrobiota bacterium]